jgi:ParB/RepB/Spo0J family partition protein
MALKEFDASSGQALEDGAAQPDALYIDSAELDALVPSPTNPRKTFDPVKLQELADSIRAVGVMQPILVRRLSPGMLAESAHVKLAGQELLDAWEHKAKKTPRPSYEIVAGERRWRASLLAQLRAVPIVVRALSDQQVLEAQLVENLQRDDLHPLEEAEGYQRLFDATGIKKEDLGTKIGKSRSYVYQRLHLLQLTAESRQAFYAGKIDFSKALLLAGVADPKQQIKALKQITPENGGWVPSVRDFRSWLEREIFLDLNKPPFDANDLTLAPGAGKCGDCPKRTDVNRDIFAEHESKLCTDSKCFGQKASVTLQRIKDKAVAQGLSVIAGVEAKKLRPSSWNPEIKGYTRMDEKIQGGKTVAAAIGKDAPTPILFVDPHTRETVKILPSDVVGDLLKKKGVAVASVQRAESKDRNDAQRRKQERDRLIAHATQTRVAHEIMARVTMGALPGFTPAILRLMLQDMLEALYDFSEDELRTLQRLWLLPLQDGALDADDSIRRHIDAAPDEELAPMLLSLYLVRDIADQRPWVSNASRESNYIHTLAQEVDVDVDAIASDVKAELKAEEAEARKATKAPRATAGAAQAGAESEENPAVKGKTRSRGAKKISAAEAKQGIADAMQGLDEPGEEE